MLYDKFLSKEKKKSDCSFSLTDDFSSWAAAVDELLSCAELGREAAADKSVKNAMAAVRHHRCVTSQFVPLQSCDQKKKVDCTIEQP